MRQWNSFGKDSHTTICSPGVQESRCGRKLVIDEFRWAGETSPMPEQELPIKADISLEPSANLPLDVPSIGETRLISLISNHSAESDVWLGERANGQRVAGRIYWFGLPPPIIVQWHKRVLNPPH